MITILKEVMNAHDLVVFYMVTLGLFLYFVAWWKSQLELKTRRMYL